MKKQFHILLLGVLALSFCCVAQAMAFPTADVYVSHSWQGDLHVDIGVWDPTTTLPANLVGANQPISSLWEMNIWNHAGGSANNVILNDIDVSAGSAYLGPAYTWYLEVYDAAGADSGSIVNFSIETSSGNYYISPDHPGVYDYATSYAYIRGTGVSEVVPEPASMILWGIGLAGAALSRRRKRV